MVGKFDPLLFQILSELFVNLSAGWIGAAVIVSPIVSPRRKTNFLLLIGNLLFAIVSLIVAYQFRKI